MSKHTSLSRIVLLAAAVGAAGVVSDAGAGVITQSAVAPTLNILTSQLADVGPGTQDNARDFTDNGGPAGQTFTIPQTAGVTGVTVLGRGNSGGYTAATNFRLRIGSVDPTTGAITTLAEESAAAGALAVSNNNQYLTFNLATPVTLTGGGTYAFSIVSEAGWYGLAHSSTDVYGGGAAVNFNNSLANPADQTNGTQRQFGGFAAPIPGGYDYTFAVQGLVPEPGSLAALGLGGLALLRRRRRPC
jgi:hypothetical protein